MRSMTGFGRASASTDRLDVSVEIKTVNSRYLDLNLRLSRELGWLEPELRKVLQGHLVRGRVELTLDLRVKDGDRYQLDEELALGYMSAAERLRSLGASGGLDAAGLLQLPGVMVPRAMDLSTEGLLQEILVVVGQAVEKVVESRASEGEALKRDLEDRMRRLVGLVEKLSREAAGMTQHYREKLEKRIASLELAAQLDTARLAQEVVHYADRCDVAEELTRLESHLEQFRKFLESDSGEAVGRRLDFIAQELSREINTLLSKSSRAHISELSVEGKTEIEKIREQVQNVE